MDNQYTELYREISDSKLIGILKHPKDYEPLAVETALKEIKARNLSETAIAEATKIYEQKVVTIKKQDEKIFELAFTATKTFKIFHNILIAGTISLLLHDLFSIQDGNRLHTERQIFEVGLTLSLIAYKYYLKNKNQAPKI